MLGEFAETALLLICVQLHADEPSGSTARAMLDHPGSFPPVPLNPHDHPRLNLGADLRGETGLGHVVDCSRNVVAARDGQPHRPTRSRARLLPAFIGAHLSSSYRRPPAASLAEAPAGSDGAPRKCGVRREGRASRESARTSAIMVPGAGIEPALPSPEKGF